MIMQDLAACNAADACSLLQMAFGLDASQTRMARNLWKEASAALSRLKEERLELLSRMGPLHPEALARQFSAGHAACQTAALMQQVAGLSENAQLQLEVARSASRKLVWQICSPENMIRLLCFSWPINPDLMYCLQTVAAP